MNTQKNSGMLIMIAACSGFLAVALGAFGAHGLEAMVSADRLGTWEKAVQYHFMHVFALMVIGILQQVRPTRGLKVSAACFIAGTFVFSGSLYLLVLLDQSWLGMITPLGGVLFLAGWLILAWGQMQRGAALND